MLDFSNIQKYRENNRVEAKKALGGLPHSIWETYAAFANTIGGVILLGVEENMKTHTLHPVDLPHAEEMRAEFWRLINTPGKVSANILSDRHVQILEADGCRIIAIMVPRALRQDRPVYIGTDPMTGAYRRNGEGDYRCTPEAVMAMQRDAQAVSMDMQVMADVPLAALDAASIGKYRSCMAAMRPGHPWLAEEEGELLYRLGAAGRGHDGLMHPTAAGVLLFAPMETVRRSFPGCRLTWLGPDGAAEWQGTLIDFYLHVQAQLGALPLPCGGDQALVGPGLNEALANCLINADYRGTGGVAVAYTPQEIRFTNPGSFRIPTEDAVSGGVSDPRNAALMRLFRMIGVGDGLGNGIPGIWAAWKQLGWAEPRISESFAPDSITLTLPLGAAAAGSKASSRFTALDRQRIIDHLTEYVAADCRALAAALSMPPEHTAELLAALTREGYVVLRDDGRYQLRA